MALIKLVYYVFMSVYYHYQAEKLEKKIVAEEINLLAEKILVAETMIQMKWLQEQYLLKQEKANKEIEKIKSN